MLKNISKINYENFTFNFLLKASSLIFLYYFILEKIDFYIILNRKANQMVLRLSFGGYSFTLFK